MDATAGIGFKAEHFEDALGSPAAGLWFEVHAENYMVAGGPRVAMLSALRATRPISLHGVGLSIAGAADPDAGHLRHLRALVDRFQPFLVSEHLAWSRHGGTCYPDLLPFPRSNDALRRIIRNIDITQHALGRQILIENPSLYLNLDGHDWSEPAFLSEIADRSGCALLVDVNNVHVSAKNLGYDAQAYIDALPAGAIKEIHLAGHAPDPCLGLALLVDSHDADIAEPVWALFRRLIERIGPRPTLIERDDRLPAFSTLMIERNRAAAMLAMVREPACV
jgi:uncharacterized protein (UPF0276 family)